MRLKTLFLFVVTIVLLVLCWLALDDITTGTEPSKKLEWATVGLTVVWLAALGAMLRRRTLKPNRTA